MQLAPGKKGRSKSVRGKKCGFTLIELLVVIAIIAILAAILFPLIVRVKEQARMSHCSSNLRQLWSGLQMYSGDYNSLPPFLASLFRRYVPSGGVYICKSDRFKGRSSFNAPDWETWQGFITVGHGPSKGCSYAYMPRVEFFHVAKSGITPLWSGPVARGNGEWVDSSKWIPNYDHWTPLIFDWWHAQNWELPHVTLQDVTSQKEQVLVLILGGSVKRCKHERLLPCADQIGSAAHPKDVLR
jgi:prepilin-type N-terminal cleavage/methylation domain-containing protein